MDKQQAFPGMDNLDGAAAPTSRRGGGRGTVSASVRRTHQLQDNTWLSFAVAVELPATATPDQVEGAATVQGALLRRCYDDTTETMLDLLLREAGQATVGQMVALVRVAQQLGLTDEALAAEADTLGISWSGEGIAGLSFTDIALLQDALVPRLHALQAKGGVEPGAPPTAGAAAGPPPTPVDEPLTLQNVGTVPIDRLLAVVVHFGKPKETGGQKGSTLEEVWATGPQRLAWIANMDGSGWKPKPNPTTGEMDPKDAVLQAAAVRLYKHLIAEKKRQEG